MKIAIAQINPKLGDFTYNSSRIINESQKAKNDLKADLLIFPELSLVGYPPYDLLERPEFLQKQNKALKKILKSIPKDLAIVIGGLHGEGSLLFNSAFFIHDRKIKNVIKKTLLPSYKVFYDKRHFTAGDLKNNFVNHKGKKIFITICEDIWGEQNSKIYPENPLSKVSKKIDHFVNLSASPYTKDKFKLRKKIAKKIAKKHNCTFTYVNQVGAQDELIFDGHSFHLEKGGSKGYFLEGFKESTSLSSCKSLKKSKPQNTYSEIFEALKLGLKDYFDKSGFEKAHLGLSGGIDSALVYVIAAEALGHDKVTPIALPGPYSSDLSLELASELAKNHGSEIKTFEINNSYNNFIIDYDKVFKSDKFGLMHENLQARLRALGLMAFSNQYNSLLLATSNKSELCVGYSTLYGDQCGALMPIGDLLKTEVFDLCKWYNENRSTKIPVKIITRPPSAELRPNQKDSDSLPEYNELDKAIESMITQKKKANSKLEKWVLNQSFKTEYKRWQACPILRVSSHGFGRGRMMPLAHNFNLD